jgi:cation diffusion facilitator CzcD-associated flavoprotein CzcO
MTSKHTSRVELTSDRLRKQGLNCKIYEKGSSNGGTWFWNCYPGARVDSDTPIYQLFDKELWEEWTFKEKYPGWKEIQEYFRFVEDKWDIKKDTEYHKCVESAVFDERQKKWHIECADGSEVWCRWFIPCVGFASKKFVPPVKNMGDFRGDIYHTALWPQHGVNLKNKRVALIGTGASGVQVAQEIGPVVQYLTIFQRTPNFALPMRQTKLDPEEEKKKKAEGEYQAKFDMLPTTFAGFSYDFLKKATFDHNAEEREAVYRDLWEKGGFRFWLNTYNDMLYSEAANDEAYAFWRRQILKRVPDPEKGRLLAPEKKPHPWGTKRPSLEQNFYEVVSQSNVSIIDVNATPIIGMTEHGISTAAHGELPIDVLICATGFDSVTGSLAQMNIRGVSGADVADHWKDGTRTSMGIALADFPNMFFLYGPQAPTAFSNGPSCVQFQANFIDGFIAKMNKDGIRRIEATKEAEEEWSQKNRDKWNESLFPFAKSWYQGANIPGKRVEPLNCKSTFCVEMFTCG